MSSRFVKRALDAAAVAGAAGICLVVVRQRDNPTCGVMFLLAATLCVVQELRIMLDRRDLTEAERRRQVAEQKYDHWAKSIERATSSNAVPESVIARTFMNRN